MELTKYIYINLIINGTTMVVHLCVCVCVCMRASAFACRQSAGVPTSMRARRRLDLRIPFGYLRHHFRLSLASRVSKDPCKAQIHPQRMRTKFT